MISIMFFFVSDSAIPNIKAISDLNSCIHISCFNHILNNTIKAGIEKSKNINQIIDKIRNIGCHIKRS